MWKVEIHLTANYSNLTVVALPSCGRRRRTVERAACEAFEHPFSNIDVSFLYAVSSERSLLPLIFDMFLECMVRPFVPHAVVNCTISFFALAISLQALPDHVTASRITLFSVLTPSNPTQKGRLMDTYCKCTMVFSILRVCTTHFFLSYSSSFTVSPYDVWQS